jgi:hypothetical protein
MPRQRESVRRGGSLEYCRFQLRLERMSLMKTLGWEWIVNWLETWIKEFKKEWVYKTLGILVTLIFGIVRGYLVRCWMTNIFNKLLAKRKTTQIKILKQSPKKK